MHATPLRAHEKWEGSVWVSPRYVKVGVVVGFGVCLNVAWVGCGWIGYHSSCWNIQLYSALYLISYTPSTETINKCPTLVVCNGSDDT